MKRSAGQRTLFSVGFISKKAPTALENTEELLPIQSESNTEELLPIQSESNTEELLPVQLESYDEDDPGTSTIACATLPSTSISATSSTGFTDLCPPYDLGEAIEFVTRLSDLQR